MEGVGNICCYTLYVTPIQLSTVTQMLVVASDGNNVVLQLPRHSMAAVFKGFLGMSDLLSHKGCGCSILLKHGSQRSGHLCIALPCARAHSEARLTAEYEDLPRLVVPSRSHLPPRKTDPDCLRD